MFDMDISDPVFQGMIQEQEDQQTSDDSCPICDNQLVASGENNSLECSNPFCNYKVQVRTRRK